MTMRLEPLSMNRPSSRQVLDCASPLALWVNAGSAKAVEDHRTPRRYRDGVSFFRFMAREQVQKEHEAFHKPVTFLPLAAQSNRNHIL
jgi:hypothetical protein